MQHSPAKPLEPGCQALVLHSDTPDLIGAIVDIIDRWLPPQTYEGKIYHIDDLWHFKHNGHKGSGSGCYLMRIDDDANEFRFAVELIAQDIEQKTGKPVEILEED